MWCSLAATRVLEGETLVHYYRLRFQIEFNFRDAKSHFGLEDWMKHRQNAGDQCRRT